MEALVTTIRLIHISAGTIALFLAPLAMLTVKGGRAHRRWGKIYFWAMAVVAATAVVMALWRPQIFLALLAVFSFYMAFTGYRTLSRKRPAQGERAAALDWTAALVTFTVSGTMTVLGLIRPSAAWHRPGRLWNPRHGPCRDRHQEVRSPSGGPERVVVSPHGRDARLVHRDGLGLLRRQLHLSPNGR